MNHSLLPRLANLIALQSANARQRQQFADRLRITPGCRVFEPAPHWVVGVLDLPWSAASDGRDEASGCFLVEGQHLLPAVDAARADQRRHLHNTPSRPAMFSETPDDISFLSVQPDGEATLLRSLGGRIPAYWWPDGEGLYLSTSSTLLMTLAEHDGRPDPLITGIYLSGHSTHSSDHRAHLAGAFCLNKAELLQISPSGHWQVKRHWQPLEIDALRWPTRQQTQDHAEQFRTLLTATLAEGLTSTGRNLLALSGGIDSSLLLAISVGQLQRPITSASIIPTRSDPTWQRETTRHAWLRSHYPSQSHLDIIDDDIAQLEISRTLKPAAIPLLNPTMSSLTLLDSHDQPCVSMGGEQADEVAGSRFFTLAEWVIHTPRWRAASLGQADIPERLKRLEWMLQGHSLKQRVVRDSLPLVGQLPSWLHRDIHAEWAGQRDTLAQHMQSVIADTANAFTWLSHTETDWQAMQWEWCSAQGVHRINPFATSRLMALSLMTHPIERLGREDKRLIRRGFSGCFPDALLARQDKGVFGNDEAAPVHASPNEVAQRLEPLFAALIDPIYRAPNTGIAPDQQGSLGWIRKSELERLSFFNHARNKLNRTLSIGLESAYD